MAIRFESIVEEFKNKTGAAPEDIFVPDYIEFVKKSENSVIEDEFEKELQDFIEVVQKTEVLKGKTIPEAIQYMRDNGPEQPEMTSIEEILRAAIREAISEMEDGPTEEQLVKQYARRMGVDAKAIRKVHSGDGFTAYEVVSAKKQSVYMVGKRINATGAYRTLKGAFTTQARAQAYKDSLVAGSKLATSLDDSCVFDSDSEEYVVFEVVG